MLVRPDLDEVYYFRRAEGQHQWQSSSEAWAGLGCVGGVKELVLLAWSFARCGRCTRWHGRHLHVTASGKSEVQFRPC